MNYLKLQNPQKYEKCGEILTSFSTEQKMYAIKCVFCSKFKESYTDFIQHIELKHGDILKSFVDLCEKQEDIGGNLNDNEAVQTYMAVDLEAVKTENNEDDVDDPLSEYPKQSASSSAPPEENDFLSEVKMEENLTNDSLSDNDSNCNEGDSISSSQLENETESKRKNERKTLNKNQNERLSAIYEKFPCLWNSEHIDFRFKKQKQKALEEMLKAVNEELHLKLEIGELEEHLSKLRQLYVRQKRNQLICDESTKKRPQEKTLKLFRTLNFLNDHIGPFKCAQCSKIFHSVDLYKIHKSDHDGSMPFFCPVCKRGFAKACNLSIHVRRHARNYEHECDVCKKRFAAHQELVKHQRVHTGEKPFLCNTCGKSIRNWSFFDRHIRRHQKRPQYFCEICEKGFYEKSKLDDHLKAHYNIRDKICNVCGKAFTCNKYLVQHKQIHAKIKNYVCTICSKEFAQYAGLSGHMKSHGTTIANSAKLNETNMQFAITK